MNYHSSNVTPKEPGRHRSFFCDRDIRRSSGDNQYITGNFLASCHGDDAGGRMIRCGFHAELFIDGFRCARDEHLAAFLVKSFGDGDYILGALALSEDHLGDALPEGAVMVHTGEVEGNRACYF